MVGTCPRRVKWERRLSWLTLGAILVSLAGILWRTDALYSKSRTDRWVDLRTGEMVVRRRREILLYQSVIPVLTRRETSTHPPAWINNGTRYQTLIQRLDPPPVEGKTYLYCGYHSTIRSLRPEFAQLQSAGHGSGGGDQLAFTLFTLALDEIAKETEGDEAEFDRKARALFVRDMEPLTSKELEEYPPDRASERYLDERLRELNERVDSRLMPGGNGGARGEARGHDE